MILFFRIMALFFYVDFLPSNQFQVIIERILYELHKNATKKYPEPQRVILELMVPVVGLEPTRHC